MKRVLAAALVVACGLAGWLGWRVCDLDRELDAARSRPAPVRSLSRDIPEEWWEEGAPAANDAPPARDPVSVARARVESLARELKLAQEKLATVEGLDPALAVQGAEFDLRAKLDEVAALPDAERAKQVWLLGAALGDSPARARQVLAALRDEPEPRRLGALAELVRAGALRSIDADDVEVLLGTLRSGAPAERRRAAAWAVQPGRWDRLAPRWAPAVAAALRAETDPTVIAALAEALAAGGAALDPDLDAARREALARTPGSGS